MSICGLLVEDARPKSVSDCILPKDIKKQFLQVVKDKKFPSLAYMFAGKAGTGKTSLALALCKDLGLEYMMINASKDNGIDTIRVKVVEFASTVSLFDESAHKVIILDEADYLNPNSAQPALRNLIEEFSNNCRFILTCNYKQKLIEPLHSRCSVVDFNIPKEEVPQLMSDIYKRCSTILTENSIEFDKAVLPKFIAMHFPDFRKILNELQQYSSLGKIDAGILRVVDSESFTDLVSALKTKDFSAVRNWVGTNPNLDQTTIFDKLYSTLSDNMKSESVPQAIIILGEYQYKAAFVSNPEINIMACLTEIMANCSFK